MPDFDLDPGSYRVRGRREPILQKGWWVGILAFACIILLATFVLKPLYLAWSDAFDAAMLFLRQ